MVMTNYKIIVNPKKRYIYIKYHCGLKEEAVIYNVKAIDSKKVEDVRNVLLYATIENENIDNIWVMPNQLCEIQKQIQKIIYS